ncbi:MAG: hypothetical protein ACYTGH_09925, partial [Planctomycetota bacterium]
MAPTPEERFKSAAELARALTFWLEGRSQFRMAHKPNIDHHDLRALPSRNQKAWSIRGNRIQTLALDDDRMTYLLFRRSFQGETRINLNVTAWPIDTEENISEF